MRLRPLWVALAILLVPAIARADGHRARGYAAYSVAKGSVLQGAQFSFDYAGNKPDARRWAWMVDYSVNDGTGFKRHTFLSGLSASKRVKHFVLEGHALGGRVWGDGSADWAGTLGFAVEFITSPAATWKGVQFAPQFQSDWIGRKGTAESFARFSGGLAFRFSKH